MNSFMHALDQPEFWIGLVLAALAGAWVGKRLQKLRLRDHTLVVWGLVAVCAWIAWRYLL